MKYVDEYRSGETAKGIAARIREEADPKREYRFMESPAGAWATFSLNPSA